MYIFYLLIFLYLYFNERSRKKQPRNIQRNFKILNISLKVNEINLAMKGKHWKKNKTGDCAYMSDKARLSYWRHVNAKDTRFLNPGHILILGLGPKHRAPWPLFILKITSSRDMSEKWFASVITFEHWSACLLHDVFPDFPDVTGCHLFLDSQQTRPTPHDLSLCILALCLSIPLGSRDSVSAAPA